MISLMAPILVFLLFLGLAGRLDRGQSGRARWVRATAIIAAVRLGVLGFLLLLHWREALGLWALPLIMVLLPEGFLLPRNQVWTPGSAVLAGVLVAIGSAVWAGIALTASRLLRRRREA